MTDALNMTQYPVASQIEWARPSTLLFHCRDAYGLEGALYIQDIGGLD